MRSAEAAASCRARDAALVLEGVVVRLRHVARGESSACLAFTGGGDDAARAAALTRSIAALHAALGAYRGHGGGGGGATEEVLLQAAAALRPLVVAPCDGTLETEMARAREAAAAMDVCAVAALCDAARDALAAATAG